MNFERTLRVDFFAVLLAVFGYLMWLILRPFLQFLLAAMLLAFLFRPAQRRLAPRIGPKVSALVLVTLAVGGTGLVVALLLLSLPADIDDVSQALRQFPGREELEQRIEQTFGVDLPLRSILESVPQRFADLLLGDLTTLVGAATDFFLGIALFLFVFYYLLQQGDDLVAWVRRSVPLEGSTTEDIFGEAHETTWAVLKGHVFVAFLQGIVAGIGLFVVGIPNVVFWSLVMMILELLPIVGVAAVLGPAVLYLVLIDRLLAAAFLVVYGATAVAVVDDYVRAMVVDRESSLHSAAILVGVFGGVYAFGIMGLFYGPIVVGLFKELVDLFNENYEESPGAAGADAADAATDVAEADSSDSDVAEADIDAPDADLDAHAPDYDAPDHNATRGDVDDSEGTRPEDRDSDV